MAHRSGNGFALIEVIVVLTITAILLVGARSIMEAVADGADRLSESAAMADRVANADALLRRLVGQIESATIVPNSVEGDDRQVRIETWCEVPAGWKERCTVELAFTANDCGEAFMASGIPGGPHVLYAGFGTGFLRYLVDPAYGGAWLPEWTQRVTLPHAIGVVLGRDTLILRIGERG